MVAGPHYTDRTSAEKMIFQEFYKTMKGRGA